MSNPQSLPQTDFRFKYRPPTGTHTHKRSLPIHAPLRRLSSSTPHTPSAWSEPDTGVNKQVNQDTHIWRGAKPPTQHHHTQNICHQMRALTPLFMPHSTN